MSDDLNTEVDELSIDITEDESDVDAQDSGNTEGESERVELDLNVEPAVAQLSLAEQNAQKQEEVWLQKVISGKAAVEDAPSWLQKRLDAKLNATAKIPETEEVVKRVLAQEREAQEFKALQATIPPLSAADAKQLQSTFSELKALGNIKALQTALNLMGLSTKVKEAEARGIAKGRISLPKSSAPVVKQSVQSVGGVPMSTVTDDKAWNELMRGH